MWAKLVIIFSLLNIRSAFIWADPFLLNQNQQIKQTEIPIQFLKSYQYTSLDLEKNFSPIAAPDFFFSKFGRTSPKMEFEAALKAFQDDQPIYGIQKTYAACAFPARKKILEKNLNIKFPDYPCVDLNQWVAQINADRVSMVFAGSYQGNPASIMGHTFIRLHHHDERGGNPLLSYAVGFMAHPDTSDSTVVYMSKGLTGQYYGGYEIEPFYQKVGIYNNSESRDLWEYELNLNSEEVNLLVLSIWELTFNSKIPYYFIDENCSYRLIQLIDIIRPKLNLTAQLSIVVLPAETIRLLTQYQLTDQLKYRASLQTKLNYKINELDLEQQKKYRLITSQKQMLASLDDTQVLDAAIDYWNMQNYKKQTQLEQQELQVMNAVLIRRAEIAKTSKPVSEEILRAYSGINPPFLGHKPSALLITLGDINHKNNFLGVDYSMGVHSSDSTLFGYEQVAILEYLKVEAKLEKNQNDQYDFNGRLVLLKALSLSDVREKSLSWGFESSFGNNCFECSENYSDIKILAQVGAAIEWQAKKYSIYVLPELKNLIEFGLYNESKNKLWLGYRVGYLMRLNQFNIDTYYDHYYRNEYQNIIISLGAGYNLDLNHQVKLNYENQTVDSKNDKVRKEIYSLGDKFYF